VDHLERNVNEAVLLEVFKQYGQVQEISLFRDAETCSSTGAGYVTFMTTDDALSAMEALDGKTQLAEDGQCLVVEWALGSSGTLCTREQEQQRERRARTLFFAKIPPNVSTTEIENLFKAFGDVNEVNLFKAWAGAKSSKGCGLVEYATREGAERAIDELHQKYCWLNTDSPMVVEWMNQSKQRSAAEAKVAKAAEACKLFVSNLPSNVTKEQLMQAFSPWGQVVGVVFGPSPGQLGENTGSIRFASKDQADAASKAAPVQLFDPATQTHRLLFLTKPSAAKNNLAKKPAGVKPMMAPPLGLAKLGLSGPMPQVMTPYMLLKQQQQQAAAMAQQMAQVMPNKHQPVWHTVNSGGYVQEPTSYDACESFLAESVSTGQMEVPVHVQPIFAAQMYASLPNNTLLYRDNSMNHNSGGLNALHPCGGNMGQDPISGVLMNDHISMSDSHLLEHHISQRNALSTGNLPYVSAALNAAPAVSWGNQQQPAGAASGQHMPQQVQWVQNARGVQGSMMPYPLALDSVTDSYQFNSEAPSTPGNRSTGSNVIGSATPNRGGYQPMRQGMVALGMVNQGGAVNAPVHVAATGVNSWGQQQMQQPPPPPPQQPTERAVVPVTTEQAYALADHLKNVSSSTGAQVTMTAAGNGALQLLLVGTKEQRGNAHTLLSVVLQNNMGMNMGVGTL